MDQEQTSIKTPEYVSLQFQLAGLGSRAAAFIIDQLILLVFNIAIPLIMLAVMTGGFTTSFVTDMSFMVIGIMIVVLFLLNYGYFFAFEYFAGGKTVGKRILGIRVIQDNGHSITLLSSFIRNLLRIIDSLPASYFLGIIMIFFHEKHKRLGDVVAGTIVVHERKPKRNKKMSALETEINRRGLTKDDIPLETWGVVRFEEKDWKLIKAYSERLLNLPGFDRNQLTRKVAEIILPKIGIELTGKSLAQLEDSLLVVYLHLKEEWEFEL